MSRPIYKSHLADTKTDAFTGAESSYNNGLAEDFRGFCENELIFIGTRAVVVDNIVFTWSSHLNHDPGFNDAAGRGQDRKSKSMMTYRMWPDDLYAHGPYCRIGDGVLPST